MFKDALAGFGLEEPPETLDLVELLERAVAAPAPAAVAEEAKEAVGDERVLTGVSGS